MGGDATVVHPLKVQEGAGHDAIGDDKIDAAAHTCGLLKARGLRFFVFHQGRNLGEIPLLLRVER